jgi:hypothetical protein
MSYTICFCASVARNDISVEFAISLNTYNMNLLRGTTALTGTSRRWYCSIVWFSVFEEQVANLLPQHLFESAWFNNQSHLVAKPENITGEKQNCDFKVRQTPAVAHGRVLRTLYKWFALPAWGSGHAFERVLQTFAEARRTGSAWLARAVYTRDARLKHKGMALLQSAAKVHYLRRKQPSSVFLEILISLNAMFH